ncbi:hypothetical protein Rrhod_1261 [Rhodococcus rhodnii LMG 5362]|uniref:Uncharacterized protein n=1 Tax=Rhodococcus rhodnii LMG 5362 TaxID=1273125 RepID=R7WPT9_9NOCA|nr:hypothetical protein Rrhod_1261 [Rhodococcus rhodnii LMG 5362]
MFSIIALIGIVSKTYRKLSRLSGHGIGDADRASSGPRNAVVYIQYTGKTLTSATTARTRCPVARRAGNTRTRPRGADVATDSAASPPVSAGAPPGGSSRTRAIVTPDQLS